MRKIQGKNLRLVHCLSQIPGWLDCESHMQTRVWHSSTCHRSAACLCTIYFNHDVFHGFGRTKYNSQTQRVETEPGIIQRIVQIFRLPVGKGTRVLPVTYWIFVELPPRVRNVRLFVLKVKTSDVRFLRILHAVSIYKEHVIRDTFWRLVKFLGKIRDRL